MAYGGYVGFPIQSINQSIRGF